MNFVAWQMLTGDRAKYAGLVCAIAFSTFLMSHQMSIFVGLLNRTQSQIKDIADAGIWVMDPKTEYLDEVRALSNQDLYRVRGVEGTQWASTRMVKFLRRRSNVHFCAALSGNCSPVSDDFRWRVLRIRETEDAKFSFLA